MMGALIAKGISSHFSISFNGAAILICTPSQLANLVHFPPTGNPTSRGTATTSLVPPLTAIKRSVLIPRVASRTRFEVEAEKCKKSKVYEYYN